MTSTKTQTAGVTTYYLNPTDKRGARIKARTLGGDTTVTLAWDHGLNSDDNHKAAADELAAKLGWLVTGWLMCNSRGGGQVFLQIPAEVS